MLDAVKRLLLREAQVQPLLVVFEDLHWIDSETQALLDSLVESLPPARLLLFVNYRPEYEHRWGSKTSYTQLRLDPLPPESAFELLHGLLGEDRTIEPLTPILIERTEGNPFFLEESVRALVETKALVGERGAYRLAKVLTDIQVPPTVQAILAARIDRLSPEDKRLLQSAAVIGKDVPFALLAAIAEEREEELRRGLAHLQAAEFLYEASLFPDLEYTFKHALTHEVAYGSLLHERRRALHARIVEASRRSIGERLAEQVERLAHHACGASYGKRPSAYCGRRAPRRAARWANREAAACFEQALAALEQLPDSERRSSRPSTSASTSGPRSSRSAKLRERSTILREAGAPRRDPRRSAPTRQRSGHICSFLGGRATTPEGLASRRARRCDRQRRRKTSRLDLGEHPSRPWPLLSGEYERDRILRGQGANRSTRTLRGRHVGPALPSVVGRASLAWRSPRSARFTDAIGFGTEAVGSRRRRASVGLLNALPSALGSLSCLKGTNQSALPWLERARLRKVESRSTSEPA